MPTLAHKTQHGNRHQWNEFFTTTVIRFPRTLERSSVLFKKTLINITDTQDPVAKEHCVQRSVLPLHLHIFIPSGERFNALIIRGTSWYFWSFFGKNTIQLNSFIAVCCNRPHGLTTEWLMQNNIITVKVALAGFWEHRGAGSKIQDYEDFMLTVSRAVN